MEYDMARTSKTETQEAPATFDDAMRILRRWYFDEIRSLAEEAMKEYPVKREDPDDDRSSDENEEDRDTWLHETIDGHEFVIYTAKAQAVILASNNPDAEEEETGEASTDDSRRAYFAMRADVREHMED
jgi:hypothetical protein